MVGWSTFVSDGNGGPNPCTFGFVSSRPTLDSVSDDIVDVCVVEDDDEDEEDVVEKVEVEVDVDVEVDIEVRVALACVLVPTIFDG